MNKGLLQAILGGVLGGVLAFNGVAFDTWGFWAVIAIASAMRFVGDK